MNTNRQYAIKNYTEQITKITNKYNIYYIQIRLRQIVTPIFNVVRASRTLWSFSEWWSICDYSNLKLHLINHNYSYCALIYTTPVTPIEYTIYIFHMNNLTIILQQWYDIITTKLNINKCNIGIPLNTQRYIKRNAVT